MNLEDSADLQVVLQVLTYSRKIMQRRDSQSLQAGGLADAGLFKDLGRVDCARRQQHLARSVCLAGYIVLHPAHALCVASLHDKTRHMRMRHKAHKAALQCRPQEGLGRVPAHAA